MIPNMIPVIEEQLREKDKEIERLNGALQTHEILLQSNTKEIERLNNIINKLEKTLLEWHEYWEDVDYYSFQYKNAYDYLQMLKGSDSK